jgi:transitional endoplasmic reticulum ATPase
MIATREFITSVDPEEIGDSVGNVRVTADHFDEALSEVMPSVDEETRQRYDEIEEHIERTSPDDEPQVSRTFQ